MIGVLCNEVLKVLKVLAVTHKGECNPVHFLGNREFGVLDVLFCERREGDIRVGQVDPFFGFQRTALNDPCPDAVLSVGLEDFKYQFAIVEQYPLTGFDVLWKILVIHINGLGRPLKGLPGLEIEFIPRGHNYFP